MIMLNKKNLNRLKIKNISINLTMGKKQKCHL